MAGGNDFELAAVFADFHETTVMWHGGLAEVAALDEIKIPRRIGAEV